MAYNVQKIIIILMIAIILLRFPPISIYSFFCLPIAARLITVDINFFFLGKYEIDTIYLVT